MKQPPRREHDNGKTNQLRTAIAKGLGSGPSDVLDMQEIKTADWETYKPNFIKSKPPNIAIVYSA